MRLHREEQVPRLRSPLCVARRREQIGYIDGSAHRGGSLALTTVRLHMLAAQQPPLRMLRAGPASSIREAAVERAMNVFWSGGYFHGTSPRPCPRRRRCSRRLLPQLGDKHGLFLRALDRYIDDALTRLLDSELDLGKAPWPACGFVLPVMSIVPAAKAKARPPGGGDRHGAGDPPTLKSSSASGVSSGAGNTVLAEAYGARLGGGRTGGRRRPQDRGPPAGLLTKACVVGKTGSDRATSRPRSRPWSISSTAGRPGHDHSLLDARLFMDQSVVKEIPMLDCL